MKQMKKRLFALVLCCLLVLTGCSRQAEGGSSEASFDDNSAIPVNQNLLDLSPYCDSYWSTEGTSWKVGGYILTITENKTNASAVFEFKRFSHAPLDQIAIISAEVSLTEISNNTVEIAFDDDGFKHSGILKLILTQDEILFSVKDTEWEYTDPYEWGFANETGSLIKNSEALKAMEYTKEELKSFYGYPDDYDNSSDYSSTTSYPEYTPPAYDTSKASGILAQSGITEEEFKNICEPLGDSVWRYGNRDLSTPKPFLTHHLACGMKYYEEHPEDTAVKDAITKWNDIVIDYQSGSNKYKEEHYHPYKKYGNLDTYLMDTVYCKKGASIIKNNTVDIFKDMQEYPNKYLGKPYVLLNYSHDLCTEYFAALTEITLTDLRDDIHNPNIIPGNHYNFYVIFNGTYTKYSGEIGLNFSILAMQKIEY
ncbi:MAG: hypothetical protein ACI4JS_08565 [Oscillospiraceae bacterium]